jgi:hypothetical protein
MTALALIRRKIWPDCRNAPGYDPAGHSEKLKHFKLLCVVPMDNKRVQQMFLN